MPDQNLPIVFEVAGEQSVKRAFEEVGNASKRSGQQVRQAASESLRYAQGPYQRLSRLQEQYQQAAQRGHGAAQNDIALAIRRNQQQIQRSMPKSVGQKWMDVFKSSRFNVGQGGVGDLMPLVGRTMAALGPIGDIAAAAALAADAIYKMTMAAAQASRAFASLQFASGSTGVQTGQLNMLGRAAGMSPEQMGGLAGQFNSRITTDPVAMMFAAQAGITNAPGAFGNQNWGQELLRMVTYLRSIKDQNERIRAARATGTESLLPLTQLSQATLNKLKADATLQAEIFNPQYQQSAQELLTSQSRVQQAFSNLGAAITGPMMDALAHFENSLADFVNRAAKFFNTPHADMLAGRDTGTPVNPQKAMQDNTDALNANTQAIKMPGHYGKGQRLNAALPPALGTQGGGFAIRQGLQAGGFRLGAFG